ncbi:S28 family serine protease [Bacteroidota bacterium]
MKKLRFGSVMAFLSLIILINVNGQSLKIDSLEKLLFELPDVIFKKLEPFPNFKSTYLIKIKQPIDHEDLSKGFFYQKVYLTHKGFDQPTLMVTEGYAMWENSDYELTELLNANQIKVEHRYFGDSKPDTLDYKYLNLKQASADLHNVRLVFNEIYRGKWISTGLSKGGVTAIVYRYFYPEDIDVCIPYVAPIITSNNDQRFITFLDTVFDADCNDKIKSFQIKLLENRDRILPLVNFYILGAKSNYNYLTIEQAFEYSVLEYPSALLEYSSCEEIPGNGESIETITKHFLTVTKMHWFSDEFINNFRSYFYQAVTEIGGYGYNTKNLENLLVAIPVDQAPRLIVAPDNMIVNYDGKLMNDVIEWLNAEGDRFIYIYGTRDYWSAGAVTPNENVNSEWFFMKDKNHENAIISEMTDSELERFISTLENWLSLEIENIFLNKE